MSVQETVFNIKDHMLLKIHEYVEQHIQKTTQHLIDYIQNEFINTINEKYDIPKDELCTLFNGYSAISIEEIPTTTSRPVHNTSASKKISKRTKKTLDSKIKQAIDKNLFYNVTTNKFVKDKPSLTDDLYSPHNRLFIESIDPHIEFYKKTLNLTDLESLQSITKPVTDTPVSNSVNTHNAVRSKSFAIKATSVTSKIDKNKIKKPTIIKSFNNNKDELAHDENNNDNEEIKENDDVKKDNDNNDNDNEKVKENDNDDNDNEDNEEVKENDDEDDDNDNDDELKEDNDDGDDEVKEDDNRNSTTNIHTFSSLVKTNSLNTMTDEDSEEYDNEDVITKQSTNESDDESEDQFQPHPIKRRYNVKIKSWYDEPTGFILKNKGSKVFSVVLGKLINNTKYKLTDEDKDKCVEYGWSIEEN